MADGSMTPFYDWLSWVYDFDSLTGWAFEDHGGRYSQAWVDLCHVPGVYEFPAYVEWCV